MLNATYARVAIFLALVTGPVLAADAPGLPTSLVHDASEDAENAIARFRLPAGMKAQLFAAEPMLANPVALHTDELGRWFVVETFRLHDGVVDIRDHMTWLDDDLACRTVEDRIAMHRKWMGPKVQSMTTHEDRIRLIQDTDGDGKADKATIFSGGYNQIEDGLASGVLARKGNVYFVNIPHLWHLRDTNGDGVADEKKSLHHGYGVRMGFIGHDLHGLRFGPDGRLYFTIGDRGATVKTMEGTTISVPDSGAVFRCEPDGSKLELFHTGLRNPQELAFDDHGNVFTGDNNCDHGDPAKWVYLVEGGDSGWRVGYQHLPKAGPWNSEKIWETVGKSTARYVVPPIAHVGDGPSGLAYYPGTGVGDRLAGKFLMADFRGGAIGSGILAISLKPKGASFELASADKFIWDVLATDVEFGVDGGIYLCDWVTGWNKPGKGRIYNIFDPNHSQSPLVLQTRRFIAEGMDKHPDIDLASLLDHPDMRVRQEAQFELAARGEKSIPLLLTTIDRLDKSVASLHAIWALGQIARTTGRPPVELIPLLDSPTDEIRAQAAKVLGDTESSDAYPALVKRLKDTPRVQFFAAQALGKLGHKDAIPHLIELLRSNDDRDEYLRHAAIHSLASLSDAKALMASSADPSGAVRLGLALALRRLESPEIAHFLDDSSEAVVLETARAINDLPISAAMPQLAALLGRTGLAEPVQLRALAANYRVGGESNATALAAFAANSAGPASMRADALAMLANWSSPSGRDRVTGLWRPIPPRENGPAIKAASAVLPILKDAPDEVRIAVIETADKLNLADKDTLHALATNSSLSQDLRTVALRFLANHNDPRLSAAVASALSSGPGALRREAIRQQIKLSDPLKNLQQILTSGSPDDQQAVLSALAAAPGATADAILSAMMDRLLAGNLPAEVHLDLLEASAKSQSADVMQKLARFDTSRKADDPLASYRETLLGGDAKAGQKVFWVNQSVMCLKCHSTPKDIGGTVGPNLASIGAKGREYLLESILLPNKQVAIGYEGIIVKTKSGKSYNGILKSETEGELTIDVPDVGLAKVKKSDIASRKPGLSAMPEDLVKGLTKRELRDLIEYMAQMK